jgi:hypothetical protein
MGNSDSPNLTELLGEQIESAEEGAGPRSPFPTPKALTEEIRL